MKQQIRLNESELKSLISECVMYVMNEEMEEGTLGNIWRGFTNAFGGDAQKIGNKARELGSVTKQGVQRLGNNIKQSAQQFGNNVKQGAEQFGNGVKQRWEAGREGFESGQKNDKIQKVYDAIQDLQKSRILHGEKWNASAESFKKTLKAIIAMNKGNVTAKRNEIGKTPVNEAIMEDVINDILKNYLN